jgi:hypothetical protein
MLRDGVRLRYLLAAGLACGLAIFSAPTTRQANGAEWSLINGSLQQRAGGILTLMTYTLFPDVTTSTLSISNEASGNPGLFVTQLGGGFTVSRSFPVYLEGNAAFTRYDPTFVATNGTEQREIPAKWTTITGTVGMGWDFRLAFELVLRPIANFTLGHMTSDLAIATSIIEAKIDREVAFLDNGRLNAVGYGGSLMLDYEHYRRDHEVDVEFRYTNIYLESISGTSEAVQGSTVARNLNLWSRWRAPTGLTALERPVRYVLEFTYSIYFEDQEDALGFNHLCSVGAGLELDTSAYLYLTQRVRLIGRYRFGDNVYGYSIGLGISF